MAPLSLSLLGPFKAAVSGKAIAGFRTKSVQALLAYLAVETKKSGPQSREFLAELFWPGFPPASGKKNLRQTLYELRKLIPDDSDAVDGSTLPFLFVNRQSIDVNPQFNLQLDVFAFESCLASGRIERLHEAVLFYRGDFLSDFYLE